MNPATINGKRETTDAFRFRFTGRQVIYLVAGILLAANTCTFAIAGKEPPNFEKLLEKGYQQMAIGNNKEAVEFFQTKLVKYPNSGECHLGLGKALKKCGKLSEAKGEFRTATQMDAGLADAYYELAVLQEGDREYEVAMQAFEKYLSLKPDAANRQNVPDRIRFCKEHLN